MMTHENCNFFECSGLSVHFIQVHCGQAILYFKKHGQASPSFVQWHVYKRHYALFPQTDVYRVKSTKSPFIPTGLFMISYVPAKLLPSVIFWSGICFALSALKIKLTFAVDHVTVC